MSPDLRLDSAIFFQLVNSVLEENQRAALPAGGPQQSIIAVRGNDRVLQILAGPGSGKTEMLVWRVLYELSVCATPSEEVMVATFTRRAATELSVRIVERCDQLLRFAREGGHPLEDPKVHNLRVGTIHSLAIAFSPITTTRTWRPARNSSKRSSALLGWRVPFGESYHALERVS